MIYYVHFTTVLTNKHERESYVHFTTVLTNKHVRESYE